MGSQDFKFLQGKNTVEVIGGQQQIDSDSFFFGGCEFQALLKHPDAALKIELDGNNLGAGSLILALALKFCQASEGNNRL